MRPISPISVQSDIDRVRRDCRKDKFLHKRGFEVLRLAETDIEMRPEWCKFEIIKHLR